MLPAMSLVIVERSFECAEDFSTLEARERAVQSCLDTCRVRPLISYFSGDREHLVCFYEAPDAEAVRYTQQQGDLPYDYLWAAKEILPKKLIDPTPKTAVVCQRALPANAPEGLVGAMLAKTKGCHGIYRVDPLGSFVSPDRTRCLCLYASPDAETIRGFNERYDLPAERVFAASVHSPS
jgi:hypothetical protein